MQIFQLFRSLRNPVFARLYAAQTTSLLGDALTWVGLALLVFELTGNQAGSILSVALTLRVVAYVLLSPLAGALADRCDRRCIMVITHLCRMVIICLLPFVTKVWQIYAIVLALNGFAAFFTPTYKATIPLATTRDEYPQAIALSGATYELLGVIGPGIAGGVIAFVGPRQIFFLDGLTFLTSACLILTIPARLQAIQQTAPRGINQTLEDIHIGTTCLFRDPPIRYALAMQLVAAIAGAQILVNTVGYVKGALELNDVQYGWIMAAFGIGATLASVAFGSIRQGFSRTTLIALGAGLTTVALLPASGANLTFLMLLWVIAGAGQSLVNLPTQTLIADRVATETQGRVYGAHFAWSHLWWAFSYPLAGWLSSRLTPNHFFYSSLIGLALLLLTHSGLKIKATHGLGGGCWHDHEHCHDGQHQHHPAQAVMAQTIHRHLHFHLAPQAVQYN